MIKYIITIPSALEGRLLDLADALLQADPAVRVEVQAETAGRRPRGPVTPRPIREDAAPAQIMAPIPTVAAAQPVNGLSGGARKVYRVIDATIAVAPVPAQVRTYILGCGLNHPTAADLGIALGRGSKSIESALQQLRAAGSIESIDLVEAR